VRRVAIVFRMDQRGGVQSCVLSLARKLNEMGIVPELLWDTQPLWQMLDEQGVRATHYPLKFVFSSRCIAKLPDCLRRLCKTFNIVRTSRLDKKYDFVYSFDNGFLVDDATPHLYYLSGPPLLPQLEIPRKGFAGIPSKIVRQVYHHVLSSGFPAYEYHKDSTYVINSQFTADLFLEAHGIELPVVYPPIRLRREREPFALWKMRNAVVFFSRIVDYKHPELVVQLAGSFPDYEYVIMGGVSDNRREYVQQLRALAATSPHNNVRFVTNPTDAQVRGVFRTAKFYVFPARNEHFGMTTVEAIDHGAVPFVHDSGGQREIVPVDGLRFGYDEFITKFGELQRKPDAELFGIVDHLQQHIENYEEGRFQAKMVSFACLV